MSTQHVLISILMLCTGIGIPVMATMNMTLGAHLSSPFVASAILFFVSFSLALSVTMATGLPDVKAVTAAPKWLMLAGFFVVFYVLSITIAGPILGIGNAVFLVLLGQIISTAVIDHYGWLGAPVSPIKPQKLLGIALIIAGIYLARRT